MSQEYPFMWKGYAEWYNCAAEGNDLDAPVRFIVGGLVHGRLAND